MMLFSDNSLLVISDDEAFLEVVRALPYKLEIISDGVLLLNQPLHYYGWQTVLLDVTTANLDAAASATVLSHFQSRILVGTHAELDVIARYAEMREAAAVNYVLKPVVLPLLKLIIDNTYSGQELSEFMSFVGMELKVPLTSIRGFSQVLEQKPLDESTRSQFYQTIHANATRMFRLIDDFRWLAQLARGRSRFSFDDYPPILIVQSAVKQVKPQVSDKQQTLQVHVADDLPRVWCVQSHLEFVLSRLLENAMMYSSVEGQITVSAVQVDDVIQFSVQDSGIGIREEDKAHIFESFFRSNDEQIRNHHGMGMSLAMAQHIVTAHQGRVWFESEYGKGSTFYFTIPTVGHP